MPYEHASASVAALNYQVAVAEPWGRAYGCATLPPACRMANRVGIQTATEPPVRPFTASPLPWNTYTFLDAPLIDFGVILGPLLVVLFGVAVGGLWAGARKRVLAAQAAYGIVAAGLVFAGRQNLMAEMIVWSTLSAALLALAWAMVVLDSNYGRGRRAVANPT